MMTREEAIARILDHMEAHRMGMYPHIKIKEALDLALAALRGPTKEMVERMFPGCPYCDMAKANDNIYNKALWVKEAETSKWTLAGKSLQYCPICGRPLTDEAVDTMLERWKEALDENT